MNFKYVLLLLILSHFAFADCAGYTENFDVRVLDASIRPIEGADVFVKFDRGTSFGEQYFTTEIKKTDSNGKAHFTIYNQGTNTRNIDCRIWITAATGGTTREDVITVAEHGSVVDLIFDDVHPVKFHVRDQFNAAIPNASVTVGNETKKTDEKGLAKFLYKEGTYDYLASYETAKQAGSMLVEDDVDFVVNFAYYRIVINVKDDYGNPLPITLTLLNRTFKIDGYYESNKTYGEDIPYEIEYKGIVESGSIVPAVDPKLDVVFDVHAPIFDSITPEKVNNKTKLSVSVSDPGSDASGVDVRSMDVRYRLEPADPSTPWSSAAVFTTAFNSFSVQFPDLPDNSVVQFRAEIKDKAGNKATVDGKFSTLVEEVEITENQTDTQETEDKPQEIPLFYIIGGVIVIVFAIYLVKRIKSNA